MIQDFDGNIFVTDVSIDRDEILTQAQLNELISTGKKRKSKVLKPTDFASTAQGVTSPPVALPVEVPVDPWESFSPRMRRLIDHITDLKETHVLPKEVRDLFVLIDSAQTVEDFQHFSDANLLSFIETIRSRLPRIQSELNDFMRLIGTSKPLQVEVDFI